MARQYTPLTIKILEHIAKFKQTEIQNLYKHFAKETPYKDFYNIVFRLHEQELIVKEKKGGEVWASITESGQRMLTRRNPEPDGIWKLVIFDIPEKQKYVRSVLRAKLKALHFKKWQNSIWISPFKLDDEVEQELAELAKKFFVRLIKTKDINRTDDLDKLFALGKNPEV